MPIHYSAPGKLFIAGEWSIMEKNTIGIVAAVNRRVHAKIEKLNVPSEDIGIYFSLKDFGINIMGDFDGNRINFTALTELEKGKLQFAKEAVEISLRYLKECGAELNSFKITTWGEDTNLVVNGELKKVGFGSSAAAVAAIVSAVLGFHNFETENERIYKLSVITHYFAQGKIGSGFDVAASTYGGVFSYIAPDVNWLVQEISSKNSIKNIVDSEWPLLDIEQMEIPGDLILCIAWTKSSANTREMIKDVKEWGALNKNKHTECMQKIAEAAAGVVEAWKTGDEKKIINSVRKSRSALAEFTKESGQLIETPELKILADIAEHHGAAGKLSGAGGGDCGFAVCFDEETAEIIINEWEEAGLYPLDVSVDMEGVRKE